MILLALTTFNMASAQWKFIGESYTTDTSNLESVYVSSSLTSYREAFGYKFLHENFGDCFHIIQVSADSLGYEFSNIYCDTALLKTKGLKKLELSYFESSEWNTYDQYTNMKMFDYLGYIDTIEIKPNVTYSTMENLPFPIKTKVLILKQDWGRRGPTINSSNFKKNLFIANNLHTL